jgi:hypothetical protein
MSDEILLFAKCVQPPPLFEPARDKEPSSSDRRACLRYDLCCHISVNQSTRTNHTLPFLRCVHSLMVRGGLHIFCKTPILRSAFENTQFISFGLSLRRDFRRQSKRSEQHKRVNPVRR